MKDPFIILTSKDTNENILVNANHITDVCNSCVYLDSVDVHGIQDRYDVKESFDEIRKKIKEIYGGM